MAFDPSDPAIRAMAAIFELTEAVYGDDGDGLSIADIEAVIDAAVSEGHGQIALALAMASRAASAVEMRHNPKK